MKSIIKKKKSNLYNDEIDIRNLYQILWQNKILILSISILSMLLFYILSLNIKKDNKITYNKYIIVINTIQERTSKLQEITPILGINLYYEFNNQFINRLLNQNNLVRFLTKSEDFGKLEEFYKSQKTTAEQYFYNKNFGVDENKLGTLSSGQLNVFLILPNNIDGKKILLNYAESTFNETKNLTKNLNPFNLNEYQLIIFNKLLFDAKKSQTYNSSLFFTPNNTIVSEESLDLKKIKSILNNKLYDLNLEYLIFLDDKFLNDSNPKTLNINALLGLTLGFFLSLMIIFLKRK